MPDNPSGTVTALLVRWRDGDKTALDRIVPLVYTELRRVARAHLKRERNPSLQPTALVHEAYLHLVGLHRMTVHDRAHFCAVSARLMRQILVNHARRRQADKRGGGVTITGLDGVSTPAAAAAMDVLAVDEALEELTLFDERSARVVELRFFTGLSISETAAALDVSTATVERDWAVAKAWLLTRLSPPS